MQLLLCGHVLVGDGRGVIRDVRAVRGRQLRVSIWADVGVPVALRCRAVLDGFGSDVVGGLCCV